MEVTPHIKPRDVESIHSSIANVDTGEHGVVGLWSAEERPGIGHLHSLPEENDTPNGKGEISRGHLYVERMSNSALREVV